MAVSSTCVDLVVVIVIMLIISLWLQAHIFFMAVLTE